MLLGKYKKDQKIAYEKIDFIQELPLILIYPEIKIPENVNIPDNEELVSNHWHRSLEIIGTRESDGYLIINGEKKYLEPKTIYVINSKDIHYLEETNPGLPYKGYALQISYQFLKEYYPDIDHLYFTIDETNKEKASSLLQMLIQMYVEDPIKNKEIILHLLKGFIEYLIKYCSTLRIFDTKIKNNKLIEIVDYLEEYYDQEIDLKIIAEQFDVSYSYMAKLFKEHLGMSAGQYINKLRFEKALIDVATSTMTITDIAYKHGYPNSSIFIKEFKKIKGVSPKQYRKMLEE